MATRQKSIAGLAVVVLTLLAAAIFGGLRAKADDDTWISAADTSWYNPIYTTFKIDNVNKLAGIAKLVNEDEDGSINGFSGDILEIDQSVLDLSGYLWVPIGTEEHPFRGTLIAKDGAMVAISGMNVKPNLPYQGLVGKMADATMGGFLFEDSGSIAASGVAGNVYAGAAVGSMSGNSTVYDITNKLAIGADADAPHQAFAGGIVGWSSDAGVISNTVNEADVTGTGSASAGGIVGFLGDGTMNIKKASNSGAVRVNGRTGTSYAGGIVGFSGGVLTLNDENTVIANSGAVDVTGGDIVYAGGIIGRMDGSALFSSNTTSTGAVAINAPGAGGSYAGGLLGALGAGTGETFNLPFTYAQTVTNHGGSHVYTGGVVGYAEQALTWPTSYTIAHPIEASGTQYVYTGGFIGYASEGLILDLGTTGTFKNGGTIDVTGGSDVYTGGIAGYNGSLGQLRNASFAGSIAATGTENVFSGGISGYDGGLITASAAGSPTTPRPTIVSDGTIGGIVGDLNGTVENVEAKNLVLKLTAAGGIAGGIAGRAQGTIDGAAAGDAGSGSYDTIRFEADVTAGADGKDNVTTGGLIGVNGGPLAVTNSRASRVALITANGRSGYTFGGIAGRLDDQATAGTNEQPVEATDIRVELKADNEIVGGAVGSNGASALYLRTARIELIASGSSDYAGGMFGQNVGAVNAGQKTENVTLRTSGSNDAVGGFAGYNSGTLTSAAALYPVIADNGSGTMAGGIVGRSEGTADARAGLVKPVLLTGEDTFATIAGTQAMAGGIAGSAVATDISDPSVSAVAPDYVSISVKGTQAKVGGLAGAAKSSSISGDRKALNMNNVLIASTEAGSHAFVGVGVGYNEQTKLSGLTAAVANVFLSGSDAVAGGLVGYNQGSNTGIIANNYLSDIILKTNATAVGATVGGLVGLNDAREGDPVANPGTAVSTIQNSRTIGSIQANSASNVIGGLVGENRSLIANASVADKLPVSSKGQKSLIGGLVGRNTAAGSLFYTYSNANLTIEGAGTLAGGLIAENAGLVNGSYVDIAVTGKAYGDSSKPVYLGGLIGRNTAGAVELSYSASKIVSNGSYSIAGGLIGELAGGTVKNSYVAESVTVTQDHSYAGGFVGRITDGKISYVYSTAEVSAPDGYAGGFAGRYDNASKELLYKSYYIKDEEKNINKDLPDFADGNHRWLDVHVRLTTILSETLSDRNAFPALSGWDFTNAWKYASLGAAYKYPEVNRSANTGGDSSSDVNANVNWYMKNTDAVSFQIGTEAELAGLAAIVNGGIAGQEPFDFAGRTIAITAPIHIQSKQWISIGDAEEHPFEGTLDGGNYLIDGLTMQSSISAYSGLFGVIGEQATVRNIALEPQTMAGNQYAGTLAALNKGAVANIRIDMKDGAVVSGGIVGGAIGRNTGAFDGLELVLEGGSRIETVFAEGIAGGLIGDNAADYTQGAEGSDAVLTIKGAAVTSASDHATVGGLIGKQTGNVTGLSKDWKAEYRVSATGESSVVGGLIGHFASGLGDGLSANLASTSLEAPGLNSVVGGLIGVADDGVSLQNASLTGNGLVLSGNGTVGGIVGVMNGDRSEGRYAIDHAVASGVSIADISGSLRSVLGGIVGQAGDLAVHDVRFDGTLKAIGEATVVGGIVGEGRNSTLIEAEATPAIDVNVKTGEAAVGGIAGSISADDINEGYDYGSAYPLYAGVYQAKSGGGEVRVAGTATLQDLYVGGIVGKNANASIYRSESSIGLRVADGKTANVGGIAGYSSGILVDTVYTGGIDAGGSQVYNAGGIVGRGDGGEIHYSHAVAEGGAAIKIGSAVTVGESVPSTRAGGLIGTSDGLKIANSYADIPLNITDENQDNTIYAGGFAGLIGDNDTRQGSIDKSYAKGSVSVIGKLGAYAGGFVGSADHVAISDAYASGRVSNVNAGLDTRSGGFAGTVERGAAIANAYALGSGLYTKGSAAATRSYTGGFAGYNDGSLTGVYANVPKITVAVTGANVFAGNLVGYNYRDGAIRSSSYTAQPDQTLASVGRNAGTPAAAAAVDAFDPLASGKWSFDYDTTIMDQADDGVFTLTTAPQLIGAAMLYNDTGVDYYRLYNRTATEGLKMDRLVLDADIDLGGAVWTPFERFADVFDGQGHTIRGLRLAGADAEYAGFAAENEGQILNVNFEGAAVEAGANAGIAAGMNREGAVISGVRASGSVSGSGSAGGVVGVNAGSVREASFGGTVTSAGAAGGIAGTNAATGAIDGSMSYGDVHAEGTASQSGGISGLNAGAINNAYAAGQVTASGTAKAWAGGIAGHATGGSINRSLNTGEVTAAVGGVIAPQKTFFGGIAGQKEAEASIAQSAYNKQMVKGNILYYDEDGAIKQGDSEGKLATELTTAALPSVLGDDQWIAHEGAYPMLRSFDGAPEGLVASAAVILNELDLIYSVSHPIKLGGDASLTWKANAAEAKINGRTATLQTAGSAALTVTAGKISRTVTVNGDVPKFAEQAAAPTVVSGDQSFKDNVEVVLGTAESGGRIYYTLDGTAPSERSLAYAGPIALDRTTTIRAIAVAAGKENSAELKGQWVKQFFGGGGGAVLEAPEEAPAVTVQAGVATLSGSSDGKVRVALNSKLKLTAPEGETIYYTTDGSTPTLASKPYTGELLITGDMVLKWITDKNDKVATIAFAAENAGYQMKSDAGTIKYIGGYADGTFKPSASITRYETIAALAPLLQMEEVNVGSPFLDAKPEYANLTALFSSAGIVNGFPDGTFGGDQGLTRAEFSKMLTIVLKLDVTDVGETKQADLKGHWAEKYVNALAKAGYVKGFPDGSFRPNAAISRAEAVVLINRIVGTKLQSSATARFTDLPASHWAYKDIMSAAK